LIKRGYKLVTTFQMPETKKAYISVSPWFYWCRLTDSNCRPTAYKSN